jgi:hypothetical protein
MSTQGAGLQHHRVLLRLKSTAHVKTSLLDGTVGRFGTSICSSDWGNTCES